MEADPTLGDILAEALTSDNPLSAVEQAVAEGDHLHVTFPDWFGAPPLGGAKVAGLVNPMAGR